MESSTVGVESGETSSHVLLFITSYHSVVQADGNGKAKNHEPDLENIAKTMVN